MKRTGSGADDLGIRYRAPDEEFYFWIKYFTLKRNSHEEIDIYNNCGIFLFV